MGVLDTTYTFTATDLVTSAKLNNVIDQTTFTATAITGTTLALSSGQLKVNALGITPMEVANGNYTINVTGSSATCTGNAATATNVAYTGLTGTVPTWNQNTTGSSASCTGNAATVTTVTSASLATDSVTTIKILDGNVTQAKIGANVVGKGPLVFAQSIGVQSVPSGNTIYTKILLGTETVDTNNNFANSRFTPTVAGYYQVNFGIGTGTGAIALTAFLFKNSNNASNGTIVAGQTFVSRGSVIVFLNGSSDFIELYAQHVQGSATNIDGNLSACLIRSYP